MTALQVIAPDHFIGAVESRSRSSSRRSRSCRRTAPHTGCDAPERAGSDVYFDATAQPHFGEVSHLDRDEMLALFAERGGDPEREGKRDALDPLLWRAAPRGRAVLARRRARRRPTRLAHRVRDHRASSTSACPFDIQGGGTDLSSRTTR